MKDYERTRELLEANNREVEKRREVERVASAYLRACETMVGDLEDAWASLGELEKAMGELTLENETLRVSRDEWIDITNSALLEVENYKLAKDTWYNIARERIEAVERLTADKNALIWFINQMFEDGFDIAVKFHVKEESAHTAEASPPCECGAQEPGCCSAA